MMNEEIHTVGEKKSRWNEVRNGHQVNGRIDDLKQRDSSIMMKMML
jgi:hypothetical protein